MPAYVPDRPPIHELQAHRVGRPASHRHGRACQDSISFLLGYCLPIVASTSIATQPSASPADIFVAYKRSPGCRAVLVAIELHEPTNHGDTCKVEVSVVSGGTAYLPTNDVHDGQLRDSMILPPQKGRFSDRTQFVDVLNVSALTIGSLEWIRIRWTDGPSTGTKGISKVTVFEVPRANIAVDVDDAGVDGGWPFTGNGLYDGTPSTLDGFQRLASEIDRARTMVRRHMQWLTVEALADAWQCGASVGAFAAVTFGRSAQPGFWTRARRLRTVGTNNRYKLVCRYSTDHASAGGQLRVTATSRTTATAVTTTLTLAASGVGTFVASGEQAGTIPCDGTDQDVRITFDFKTDAGANLRISEIALIEDET